MKVDWSNFISPRERAQLEKERNAPSPYQSYSYADWKNLTPSDKKLPKPQSQFERDYDRMPDSVKPFITGLWKLEEELSNE